MSFKNYLHRQTVARFNYFKKLRSTGVSFSEYCDYIYEKRNTGNGLSYSFLFGKQIKRNNTFWFVQNVHEIFVDEVYKFKSSNDSPLIIDCGVNIGLSLIYFKKLFPKSRIIAFEADEQIYQLCKHNLLEFELDDIELINAAVWDNDGILNFLPDNSLGGKVVEEYQNIGTKEVKSIRLKKFLSQKVDFLKIDIEGAEYKVLLDCRNDLLMVKNLFIEYHSQTSEPQMLSELLEILREGGFRYYIKEAWNNMTYPFIDYYEADKLFYDLQLNIYAYRS